MVSNTYNLHHQTNLAIDEFNPDVQCQNMGLLLDKYMPANIFAKGKKSEWLSSILKPIGNSNNQNNHIDPDFAKQVYERWKKMLQSRGITPFELEVDWRMVVGLGGETILETDLTLHHLYGIPIIPGSALKGLARAYAAGKKDFFVPEDKAEEERQASKDIDADHSKIKCIFGKQDEAGTVCFFDAMPVNGQAHYVVDIMNPHYPDYYRTLQSSEIIAPTNDQPPNPVMFLTVEKTTFSFALAPRKPGFTDDVALVRIWLQEALQRYGIGGKTSAGYGYFKAEPVYTRPTNLAQFQKGQAIRGIVLDEKSDKVAKKYVDSGLAIKCLRLLPFTSNEVVIIIPPTFEEAKNWKTMNNSICLFIEERVEDNRTLLICEPKKKKQ